MNDDTDRLIELLYELHIIGIKVCSISTEKDSCSPKTTDIVFRGYNLNINTDRIIDAAKSGFGPSSESFI